jgi:hypothetical protein
MSWSDGATTNNNVTLAWYLLAMSAASEAALFELLEPSIPTRMRLMSEAMLSMLTVQPEGNKDVDEVEFNNSIDHGDLVSRMTFIEQFHID